MKELMSRVPDVEIVLALTPEELGRHLLKILASTNKMTFHERGPSHDIWSSEEVRAGRGYPREKQLSVDLALAEGISWLETHDLIMPEERGSGHMRITRLGASAALQGPKGDHAAVTRLRKDMLHPEIAEEVWIAMVRGDYSDAVFKAMRAVEIGVRETGNYEPRDTGTKLMRLAFGKSGSLRDLNAEASEADALEHLFAGAIGSYKNPHSHRNVPMDDSSEVIEIVMLASHLLRIVDARRGNGANT